MIKRRTILGVFLGALLAAMLAITALSGCSFPGAPATTETLLMRYVANKNASNFNTHAQIDLSVSALGVRAKVPITADFKTSQSTAHGTITANLSALDTRDYSIEVYAELQDDSIVCYLGSPADKTTTWKRWTINTTSSIDLFTLTELLKASELTKIAKDSDKSVCYELTIPTAVVLQTAFKLSDEPVVFADMDENALLNATEGNKFRFDFTSDCLLRSVDTSALVSLRSADTNNVAVKVGLNAHVLFDDYGTVRPQTTSVPNKVRDNAVTTDNPIDLLEVLGKDSPLAGAIAA